MTLYTDNILTTPRDFDWSEGYTETWDIVAPDFSSTEGQDLADYLELSAPDRAEMVSHLENIGIACYDDEPDSDIEGAYWDSVNAGDIEHNDRYDNLSGSDSLSDLARERFDENSAPMMDYFYPIELRQSPEEAAQILTDHCLTLVRFEYDDSYALALTGGGMDLSAEICQAYIALGQRPPVHFCRIPRMAGTTYSKEFINTLIESCEISQRWSQNTIDDLRAMSQEV